MKGRAVVIGLFALTPVLVFACGGDSKAGATNGPDAGLLDGSISANDASGGSGEGGSGGGGSGTGGSTPSGPRSERAACRAYLTAACERIAACNEDPSLLEGCLALLDQCPDYLFSDGSARTIDSVFACAAEWSDLPCAQVGAGDSPSCAAPGTRPPGESCMFVSQCESLRCSTAGNETCGVCLSIAGLGEPCDGETIGCALGQECLGVCEAVVWTPPAPPEPVPDAEAPSLPGESCWGYIGCVEGYECLRDELDDSIQTCQRLPEPGESCMQNSGFTNVCAEHAYCSGPPDGICLAKPVAGEPCYFTSVWDCADGHECETGADGVTRTCIAVHEEGEPCGSSTVMCAPGTACRNGDCVATDEKTMFEACEGDAG